MDKVDPTCCYDGPGCYDCDNNSRYIQTNPVLTPFYRTILDRENVQDGIPAPENSYLPYDLFTFRTKFERKLYGLDPTYHFSFVSKQIHNVMRLTIDIYKGATFVPLNVSLASRIQQLVDECVSTYPKLCLLLDARVPITRGTKTLTKSWMRSLFPFLSFEKRFHAVFEEGRIYIDLRDDVEYTNRYTKLYLKLVDVLFDYYKRGLVPLSPKFHNDIINNWSLEKVYEQYVPPGQGGYPGEIALYEATWKNHHFAPDMVSFLYDRVQSIPEIKILVGDNFVRRHFVATELRKFSQSEDSCLKSYDSGEYIPIFSGKYVYVPAENVAQAFEIANVVADAKYESTGKVDIVPLEKEEDYDGMVRVIISRYPYVSENEESIVLYQTIDVPKFLLSFLVPRVEASDSLRILKT